MLQKLIAAVSWCSEPPTPSNLVIFMDDGFAEQFKWDGQELPPHPIFPLHFDTDILSMLRTQQPKYVIVLVSTHERNLIHNMKVVCMHASCLHIVVAALILPESESELQQYTSLLATELQPVLVDFYPVSQMSAVQMLSSSMHNTRHVGLFMLSSPSCRDISPLSLYKMGILGADSSVKCVNDILAEDIPPHLRHELKLLAGEIVNSVVDTLGLDPSGFIFAFGKTSSILGHSLHPLIANSLKLRAHGSECNSGSAHPTPTPLTPASLLLVDRTLDLCTPGCMGTLLGTEGAVGSTSSGRTLLSRVLATIPRQKGGMNARPYSSSSSSENSMDNGSCEARDGGSSESNSGDTDTTSFDMFDINLQSAQLYPHFNTRCSSRSGLTLSGLLSLPIQIAPTICRPAAVHSIEHNSISGEGVNVSAAIDINMQYIWSSFATQSEEECRALLCSILSKYIDSEHGALPPVKKRGFGAELLALVGALVVCPGSNTSSSGSSNISSEGGTCFNTKICLKYITILSFTASIIDALQRSSSKQFKIAFPELGIWKSPYEDRCAVESRWMGDVLTKIRVLGSTTPSSSSSSSPMNGMQSLTRALRRQQAVDDVVAAELENRVTKPLDMFKANKKGVPAVDISHFLLFILSVSAMWGVMPSTECLKQGSTVLVEYILNMCTSVELKEQCWLPVGIAADITRMRKLMGLGTTPIATAANSLTSISGPGEHIVGVEDGALLQRQLTLELCDAINQLFARMTEFVGLQQTPLIDLVSNTGNHSESSTDNNTDNSKKSDVYNGGGLLQQIVSLLLHQSRYGSEYNVDENLKALRRLDMAHIADPLKMLARAGLDLLSYGLNSFGLSSAPASKDPHPSADREVVVLFVVGGLSPTEIGQVQRAISEYNRESMNSGVNVGSTGGGSDRPPPRIILGSNNLITPDGVCKQVFSK